MLLSCKSDVLSSKVKIAHIRKLNGEPDHAGFILLKQKNMVLYHYLC